MTRMTSLLILSVLSSHALCSADEKLLSPKASTTRPSFIIILADDLGAADLGCYGNSYHETPHIDQLAKEGLLFKQFYAGPVCSPTRANLQSGQDQARFGITQHIPGHRRPFARLIDPVVPAQLPLEVETFAERLQAAGYATGYFGKWHLGGDGFGPRQQGWQTAVETRGHTMPSKSDGGEPRRTAAFLTEQAVGFISAHRDQPFLLQVSHHLVHIPLAARPELIEKYKSKTPQHGYPGNPAYAALLEELDESVGNVVAAVDRLGISDRTVILFLSDNGGLEHEQSGRVVTSNKPLRGEKGTLYEGGIRIPAIARWSNTIQAGGICTTPSITYDLYPTLLELAHATASTHQPQDGVSLAEILTAPEQRLSRDTLYWHLPHYHHSTPASAIRQGDWKLIEFFESGECQLFNLQADPGEQNNLAALEKARVETLQMTLSQWRERVKARLPVPNPQFDAARANERGRGSNQGRPSE